VWPNHRDQRTADVAGLILTGWRSSEYSDWSGKSTKYDNQV